MSSNYMTILNKIQKQTDASIYDRVYADIKDEKELYEYKRKRAKELLELQADNFVEKQKSVM